MYTGKYGTLEYSYTKGFRNKMIINIYLDHRLQTLSNIRVGDRIASIYDFTQDEGMISKVLNNLPPDIKRTDYPKLTFSSQNKLGKIKTWYEVSSDYYMYLMLPPEIIGEQIKLNITEVKDGSIHFTAGSKRTIEEVTSIILTNALDYVEDKENVKRIIRDLKNGKKVDQV